jgi:poly(3-hydroxybutyrate) depolymerase
MAGWDDLGFLEQMIANVVASKPVDPEQIYVTGFSLGCMMAQRFAMERSKLVAGLGCHGGELSGVGIEPAAALDSYKSRYDIQAMPIYNTGGSADVWITRAGAGNDDFSNWLYWNGCSNSTTSDMTLTSSKLTAAIERTGSSCATYVPTLETKMVVITGLGHVHDPRMAKYIWDFLSQYKRPGAATQLPEAVAEIDPASIAVTVTNSVRQHAPPRLWRIAACLLLLTLFSCV